MCLRAVLLFIIVQLTIDRSHGQGKKPFFRDDYEYLEATNSFYKIHEEPKNFDDAKKTCDNEGAILFIPEDPNENDIFRSHYKEIVKDKYFYVGLSDLLVEGAFETVDGRPVSEVYHKWGPNQPDNNNEEDCVLQRPNGDLNDYPCYEPYPFVCKKFNKNRPKPFFRKDYEYLEATDSFYKIYEEAKSYADAKKICDDEGTILFIPEDQNENDIFRSHYKEIVKDKYFYVGLSDLLVEGVFETVDGRPATEVYHKWGPNEPNNFNNEDCVLQRPNGDLNDYSCHEPYAFVCKKFNKKRPKHFFREDYEYLEATDSFYKIHEEGKNFTDAKKTCDDEGTILFIPEDQNENDIFRSYYSAIVKDKFFYVGLSDLMVEGVFETVDGRPVSEVYHKWGPNQPDNSNEEDCVLQRPNGDLNDYTCHEPYSFVCKKFRKKRSGPFFREDYEYLEATNSFYKIHEEAKNYADAKKICDDEGTILFIPEDQNENDIFRSHYNETIKDKYFYVGLTDQVVEGVFETVDGRPISQVYHKWGPNQPDNFNNEDCVLQRPNGDLNDYTCHESYPFTCKKTHNMSFTQGQQNKPLFRKDYVYLEATRSFYKIHKEGKDWFDAKKICDNEGAKLFIPEDENEVNIFLSYFKETLKDKIIYIGISDLFVEGDFETIDGRPLSQVYNKWAPNEPNDDTHNEDCTVMRTNGETNVIACANIYPFTCKKKHEEAVTNGLRSKPFFREDYTYVEATGSFYKIHVDAKKWLEANQTCADEGAILFVPEDDKEVSVFIWYFKETQKDKELFIGITDLVVEGFFVTVDGRPISQIYHKWAPDEPNDTSNNEDCVVIRPNGELNDGSCSSVLPFTCKKIHDVAFTRQQQDHHFFRNDYEYLEATSSFYKVHTVERTWFEAKKICTNEGANLFIPEDQIEVNAVLSRFNESLEYRDSTFVGISDLVAEGVFETNDGRSIVDVFHKWRAGEPNNKGYDEDCVALLKDGNLNDDRCKKTTLFICKKTAASIKWNPLCNMPLSDYTYSKNTGRCYKFHSNPANWTDAHALCAAEQSYLAVINSQEEANYLVQLTAQHHLNKSGDYEKGTVFLGIHNQFDEGWTAVRGSTVQDSGYTTWAPGQPDGNDSNKCGSMLYNGQLSPIGCEKKSFFICEHDIKALPTSIHVLQNIQQ